MLEDAELIAKNWGQDVAAQITSLPRYSFMVRSFENDLPVVRTVVAHPPLRIPGKKANPTKLIKQSLERWGKDKKDVNEQIRKFLAA